MARRPSLINPVLLGFDEIERALERVAKGADGYPSYNIERIARENSDPREDIAANLPIGTRLKGWVARASGSVQQAPEELTLSASLVEFFHNGLLAQY